jgi:hypothetical protein
VSFYFTQCEAFIAPLYLSSHCGLFEQKQKEKKTKKKQEEERAQTLNTIDKLAS